jgi:hypothetical protein
MVQRLCGFLFVFMLLFSGEIFGQEITMGFKAPKPSDTLRFRKFMPSQFVFPVTNYLGYNDCMPGQKPISLNIVPASFYATHLGFICKKELQLDKITAIPFRFRLGSLAYVNYLEQKPNAINPQR